jgi:hypothetical protein
MAHRDFSTSVDEALKNRPTFTLNDVVFMCKPGLSWKTMASVLSTVNEAGDDPDKLEGALLSFFDVVLIKDARPKMHELLSSSDSDDDDAVPISLTQLTNIVRWLVEQYTGVPTVPSLESSPSANGTGDPSKVDVSFPEGAASST